jgi:hypothetical protein
MVNGQIRQLQYTTYEDYASLKKYIGSALGRKYDHMFLHRFSFNQAGTGSEVEFEEKGGLTIADIGKTELTVVGAMSANDDDYDGAIATLVYYSNDGVQHTATCTINTTDSTTEVDFLDVETGLVAVVDYYCPVSLSLSMSVKAGHTFGMGATGALTYGVIQAEESEAVDDDLIGVGQVYTRYSHDASDYYEAKQYYSYITPWGEVKYAYSQQDDTDSTTEVKLYEVEIDTGGFTSGDWSLENLLAHGTAKSPVVSVKDFWRRQYITTEVTPGSGHNMVICNSDMSAIYGVVEESNYESYHSRFVAPVGSETWLGRITASQSVIVNVVCNVTMYYTPLGEEHQHSIILPIANNSISQIDPIIPIEPGTEVKFTILGNLSSLTLDIHFLEAALK